MALVSPLRPITPLPLPPTSPRRPIIPSPLLSSSNLEPLPSIPLPKTPPPLPPLPRAKFLHMAQNSWTQQMQQQGLPETPARKRPRLMAETSSPPSKKSSEVPGGGSTPRHSAISTATTSNKHAGEEFETSIHAEKKSVKEEEEDGAAAKGGRGDIAVREMWETGQLEKLTVGILRMFCRRAGLPTQGKKADLLERCEKYFEKD